VRAADFVELHRIEAAEQPYQQALSGRLVVGKRVTLEVDALARPAPEEGGGNGTAGRPDRSVLIREP